MPSIAHMAEERSIMSFALRNFLASTVVIYALAAVFGPGSAFLAHAAENEMKVDSSTCPRANDPIARKVAADCYYAIEVGRGGLAMVEIENDTVACIEVIGVLSVPPLADGVAVATVGDNVVKVGKRGEKPANISPGGLAIYTRHGRIVVLTVEFNPDMLFCTEETGIDVLKIRFDKPARAITNLPCPASIT